MVFLLRNTDIGDMSSKLLTSLVFSIVYGLYLMRSCFFRHNACYVNFIQEVNALTLSSQMDLFPHSLPNPSWLFYKSHVFPCCCCKIGSLSKFRGTVNVTITCPDCGTVWEICPASFFISKKTTSPGA